MYGVRMTTITLIRDLGHCLDVPMKAIKVSVYDAVRREAESGPKVYLERPVKDRDSLALFVIILTCPHPFLATSA